MKRKKGFTLIELVVTMVIGCILMVSLTSILTLAQNGTYQTQRGTRATQAGEAIYEYIANQLKYAERVYIGDDGSHKPADPASWNAITVSADGENGLLTVNGTQVYPLDYQEDCALTLSAAGRDRDQLDLTVALADNRSSGTLYSKSSAITLSNLEGNGFGQTEGIVGAFLTADGFGSGTTIVETGATVGKLVIYYKGGGSTIPVFNPDGGQQPQPTPGPSALSVLLPSRLDIEVGKTEILNSYVTLPTGATNVTYTWSFDSNDKFSHTPADSTGPNATSYALTGIKITDAANPVKVELFVECFVNGIRHEAYSNTCLVTVWQNGGDCVLEYEVSNGTWTDATNKTFFVAANTSFQLRVISSDNRSFSNDSLKWESSNHAAASPPSFTGAQGSFKSGSAGYSLITIHPKDTNGNSYHCETNIVVYDKTTFQLAWKDAPHSPSLNVFYGEPVIAQLIVNLPKGAPYDCLKDYSVSLSDAQNGDTITPGWDSTNWSSTPPLFKQPDPIPIRAMADQSGKVTFELPGLEYNRDLSQDPETMSSISLRLYLTGYENKKPSIGENYFTPRLSVTVNKYTVDDAFHNGNGSEISGPISISDTKESAPLTIIAPMNVQHTTDSTNAKQWRWKVREVGKNDWKLLPQGNGKIDNFFAYSLTDSFNQIAIWKIQSNAKRTYELALEYLPNNSTSWRTASSTVTITLKP